MASASPVREDSTTSSAEGMTRRAPSRRTVEVALVISDRAATASAALFSWMNPRTALRVTTARMTRESTGMPWAPSSTQAMAEMTIAPSSRKTRGSLNWARKRFQAGTGGLEGSSLGPCSARSRAASAALRPVEASVPRAVATASAGWAQG